MYRLPPICLAVTTACLSMHATASDFNLPFVNSAGLGVAYADWASAATDASTAYTNPAGLVNLPHRQIVSNILGITGSSRFTGSSLTPSYPFPAAISQSGSSRSPINAFSPSFFFATPLPKISERLAMGFNFTAPFGLGTHYDATPETITRYAATRSTVLGIDVGPSLAFKVNDFIALGAGFDALHLAFTLNNVYGPPLSMAGDAPVVNHLNGWGYGWHGGTLFTLSSATRIGLSYNSKISIKTSGHSTVYTPFDGTFRSHTRTNASLPARAQFSLQHDITQRLTAMTTVFYVNWKTFKEITMDNVQTPMGSTVPVTIPFNYHNCFDYSLGLAYKATDQWTVRSGIQFMNTPSNDYDRGIADPIGGATVLTVGGHFRASEAVSFDIGVGHSFFKQMPINFKNQLTALTGHTNTQTTAIGGQLNYNFT